MSNNLDNQGFQSNIQEIIAAYTNNTVLTVNNITTNIAGIDILYFRALPVDNGKDFIFQSYTLYNVEDTPIKIKAIYNNAEYNDSGYVFQQLGIDYEVPFSLEIDFNSWVKATNNDKTTPLEHDIIFIPLTNKLWEVNSMNPTKLSGQVITYKLNCTKYKPSRNRYLGDNLKTSIEENTVDTDKLFKTEIQSEIADIVDNAQLSQFSSTSRDTKKNVTLTPDTSNYLIFPNYKVNSIIAQEINVDGHMIAKSMYNLNIPEDIVVSYESKSDLINENDTRCLSEWINILPSTDKEYNISSININSKIGRYTNINITGNISKISLNDILFIYRGNNIIFIGKAYEFNLGWNIQVYNEMFENFPENWNELPGFKFKIIKPINLLSASALLGNISFSIDLYAQNFITINYNSNLYIIKFSESLKYNNWYGIILNLNKESLLSIFDSETNLHNIFNKNFLLQSWTNNNIEKYYIKSGNAYMTNIRLYDIENKDIDTQLIDLITYNIQNASHAIINDSADIPLNKDYIGQQR